MTDTTRLGNKLGPRLAQITERAVAATAQKTAHIKQRTALSVIDRFFRVIGSEQRAAVGPLIASMSEHDDAPEWFRTLGKIITEGSGQWGELVTNAVVSAGVASSLTGVLTNELAPVTLRLIEENPQLPLDPGSAAKLVAQGVLSEAAGTVDAARGGMNDGRFQALLHGTYSAPGLSELATLINRGDIDVPLAAQMLHLQGIHPAIRGQLLELRHYVQSPADLALAVLKGWLTQEEAAAQAKKTGLDTEQFKILTDITGEPPGVQDMLFMFRRGIIDAAKLEHGIRESRLRIEWLDEIKAMAHVPISASDAVQANVQNHIDTAEARKIVAMNGVDPKYYDVLYETAGNPPGPHEMLELWNRGKMSKAEVIQGFRESRLKNKYNETLFELRRHLLTAGEVNLMVAQGAMTIAEAIPYYTELGYTAEDGKRLATSASISRQARQYELTAAEIGTLYQERGITAQQAIQHLMDLGYDHTEAELHLKVQDLQRQRRFFEAAITRVHTLFVTHKITPEQTQTDLDSLHVPATQKADLLAIWGMEAAANVATLTVAQIQGAARRGLISFDDAVGHFQTLGYTPEDSAVLLALAWPATAYADRPAAPGQV